MLSISVIVPVYKVESQYLCECIDSILNQSFDDFELILVDDGAPKENADILDEYKSKDNRIKVIHQENKGVSAARNVGLDAATGEYVTFVDSDDTIECDNLKDAYIYAKENSLEALMWGINLKYPTREKKFIPYCEDIKLFDEEKKYELMLKCLVGILPFFKCPPATCDAAGSACAKLYLKSFLDDNELRYTPGLKRAEDMTFNIKVFDKAARVGSLNRFYYNYRQLQDSATYVYRDGGIEVFNDSLEEMRKYFTMTNASDLTWQVYYMRCMFFFLESMDMDYMNKNNPKPLFDRLKEMKAITKTAPYNEAFSKLRGEHLVFSRKIPLFLIKRGWMGILAVFYKMWQIILK